MAPLTYLYFRGDALWERRIKEATNFVDTAHIHTATYAVCQMVLAELGPMTLDGNPDFSVCLNIDQPMQGQPGYNWSHGVNPCSFYNLDPETSRKLYDFRRFDREFQRFTTELLLDILAEADQEQGGSNRIPARKPEVLARLEEQGWQKKLPVERFCKTSRDKKHRAMVCRCLSQQVGEAIRVELVRLADGETVASRWITAVPGYLPRVRLLKKTCWEGRRFCLWTDGVPPTTALELPDE